MKKPSNLEELFDLRSAIMANGFMPVAIENAALDDKSSGKKPLSSDWVTTAVMRRRKNVFKWTDMYRWEDQRNTGILCNGLRAIDIDIDDNVLAKKTYELMIEVLGKPAMVRTRSNSARCLALYAAADGEPHKDWVGEGNAKIEVLGAGNQFVGFGGHYSGVNVEWVDDISPANLHISTLLAVPEELVKNFLIKAGELIGIPYEVEISVEPKKQKTEILTYKEIPITEEDVNACLAEIPCGSLSYDEWLHVGAAFYDAGGSFFEYNAWCKSDSRYDGHRATQRKWNSLKHMTKWHFGTLLDTARKFNPKFVTPSLNAILENRISNPTPESVDERKRKAAIKWRNAEANIWDCYNTPVPTWLIEGFWYQGQIANLYSESNVGKTWVALDMALRISAGLSWHGRQINRKTKVGKVIYIGAEAANSVRNRAASWASLEGIKCDDLTDFLVLTEALDLLCDEKIEDFIEYYSEHSVECIFIDTLACSMASGENENSNNEMAKVVSGVKFIAEKLNCGVMILHHPGKSGTSERGGSAYKAGIDASLKLKTEITKENFDVLKIEAEKQRDGKRLVRYLKMEAVPDKRIPSDTTIRLSTYNPVDAKTKEIWEKIHDVLVNENGLKTTTILKQISGGKQPNSRMRDQIKNCFKDGEFRANGNRYTLNQKGEVHLVLPEADTRNIT